MRIVFCHEFLYLRGGAERYMFDLMELLVGHGHEVIPFAMQSSENQVTPYADYFVSNLDFPQLLKSGRFGDAIRAGGRALYSVEARSRLLKLLQDTQPDLVHVFGFAHYLSASIFDAAKRAGVPVLQSLLDYKWICPNTTFLSQGTVCEKCKVHRYYNIVLRRCKRNSLSASLLAGVQAYLVALTRAADKVALFLCHSRYLMDKMIEYGYARQRFRYIPHFLDVDSYPDAEESEPFVVYFGRLSYELGLHTLLRAAEVSKVNVRIIGRGPEEDGLKLYAKEHGLGNVQFLGPKWGQEMRDIVSKGRCVVCPSEWYENSPLAVYEAMAMGRPVVGSNVGGIPELVQDRVTGLLFQPGDPEELATAMRFMTDNANTAREWGREARRIAKRRFTPDKHYEDTLAVYEDVIRAASGAY